MTAPYVLVATSQIDPFVPADIAPADIAPADSAIVPASRAAIGIAPKRAARHRGRYMHSARIG